MGATAARALDYEKDLLFFATLLFDHVLKYFNSMACMYSYSEYLYVEKKSHLKIGSKIFFMRLKKA